VLERKPAGYRSFDEVKDAIRAQLVDEQAKDMARNEITKIASKLRSNKPKNAVEFTGYANDKVSSNDTLWFGKSEAIPGIGNNPALTTWAFSAKQGDIGDIIGTQRGPAIPYLYAIRPAGVSDLAEVRARVEADARNAKALELARQELAKALPATNIDDVAKKLGLTAQETTLTRQGFASGISGDTSAIVNAAMSGRVGEMVGPIVTNDSAIVMQIEDQKKVNPTEAAANRAAYAEMLRQQEARNLRTVLLQRLRKESSVEINPAVTAQAKQTQQAGL
jgi:hypothetical protein